MGLWPLPKSIPSGVERPESAAHGLGLSHSFNIWITPEVLHVERQQIAYPNHAHCRHQPRLMYLYAGH